MVTERVEAGVHTAARLPHEDNAQGQPAHIEEARRKAQPGSSPLLPPGFPSPPQARPRARTRTRRVWRAQL